MTVKQHILRTASEIAMGRYMRAPDHPVDQAAADEFAAAFNQGVVVEEDPNPASDPAPAPDPAADPALIVPLRWLGCRASLAFAGSWIGG